MSHAEDASAGGDEAFGSRAGSGMEYRRAGGLSGFDSGDDVASSRLAWVSVGSHNDTDRWLGAEGEEFLVGVAARGFVKECREVAVEAVQQALSFGIAKTDIEFEDLHAGGGHHETRIEESRERSSRFGHAVDDGLHDGVENMLALSGGEDFGIGVGTHAAGVGTPVTVIDGFVVLGWFERDDRFAITDGDEADFFALEEFFDDDFATRRADEGPGEEVGERGFGFGESLCDHHTLACREPVGFQDDGQGELLKSGSRLAFGMGDLILGGWDAVGCHEVFGKDLTAFELGGGTGGAEDEEALGLEAIHEAIDEGRLWSYNCKINFVGNERQGIVGVVPSDFGGAGIAWGDDDF